ncbi:hypothetical protein ONE63_003341 [Megalurothrips usitatus]|uniref:Uncharacterized protein n=1 Tax=Megalurothrips usitatus TaxID=439358 RepID=A0AAV7X700_9NEOP|nr:hypothetical protein ONE63_003341 [Megalurothrips usitatus]
MACGQDAALTRCDAPCQRTLPCGHRCRLKCSEDCSEGACEEPSPLRAACGHDVMVPCSKRASCGEQVGRGVMTSPSLSVHTIAEWQRLP